ncbi:MAG: DUF423 domain-containing protein [Pseudomonadota bacterium]
MRVVVFGALNGLVAVGLGAVATHLLSDSMTVADAGVMETAVFYQALHAAVLVAMGALKDHVLPSLLGLSAWALGLGVVLFSGSLYVLSFGGPAEVAMVTPVGGALLLVGWLVLAVAAARRI